MLRASLLLFLLPIVATSPAAAQLTLAFEPEAVVARGVPPEASVAFLAVEREPTGSYQAVRFVQEVGGPAGQEGTVRLELERPVAFKAVWAAVELAGGELTLATPTATPVREEPFEPGAFAPGSDGEVDGVGHPRRLATLLVVRPGEGAWAGLAADGGEADADGVGDGQVRVSLGSLGALDSDSRAVPEALRRDHR
jgi:hypothetical protein